MFCDAPFNSFASQGVWHPISFSTHTHNKKKKKKGGGGERKRNEERANLLIYKDN